MGLSCNQCKSPVYSRAELSRTCVLKYTHLFFRYGQKIKKPLSYLHSLFIGPCSKTWDSRADIWIRWTHAHHTCASADVCQKKVSTF